MNTFRFDDAPIGFRPGQTLGGALMAAGIVSWRSTRREEKPRGLFCGIGVCFDCLITVDGVPNQRACLTVAGADMEVTTNSGTGWDGEAPDA
jgi:predicted molibdopterin-dependent oxidoreductase YjgC